MYGAWPASLYTYTQLRRMKLKPVAGPAGCYFIRKSPYQRYLYDIHTSVPRRVPTERQREAIRKMRAALVETYTCRMCGYYDRSHGQDKHAPRLLMGYCPSCRWEIRQQEKQIDICAWAHGYVEKLGSWIVLDTETTGLGADDEVIELAIVSSSGAVLFSSLIQPQDIHRPDLATHIHGITADMLRTAPTFPEVWPIITAIFRRYRHVLVYNAAFDHRLLDATAGRYGCRLPAATWDCLMEQYAVYYGAWHSYYRSYTWQTLQVACTCLGVEVTGEYHRATADALASLGVLRVLASYYAQSDTPAP